MSPTTWNEAAHEAAAKIAEQAERRSGADEETLVDWITIDMRDLRSSFSNAEDGSYYPALAPCLASHALALLAQRSGDGEGWLASEIADLAARKHHDYGTSNIEAFGLQGLIVRTSDKVERLKNLIKRDVDGLTESLDDTLRDLVGYAIVGILWTSGQFYLPLAVDAELISVGELKLSAQPVVGRVTFIESAAQGIADAFDRKYFVTQNDEAANPLLAVNREFNEIVRSQGKTDGPKGLQALIDNTNDTRPWESRTEHDSAHCGVCQQSAHAARDYRVDL